MIEIPSISLLKERRMAAARLASEMMRNGTVIPEGFEGAMQYAYHLVDERLEDVTLIIGANDFPSFNEPS